MPPAAPSPANVPLVTGPPVTGPPVTGPLAAAVVAGAVYARPDGPEAEAPSEVASQAVLLEAAGTAVPGPAVEPEIELGSDREADDEPEPSSVDAFAPATDSFEYGADTSLPADFYGWAGEPAQASNDDVPDEPEAEADDEMTAPFASDATASQAGTNGSWPWHSDVAAPIGQAGAAEAQDGLASSQDGLASSEAPDEQIETSSGTFSGTEALPAAPAGTVTEHSWDPMLSQKARLDHQESQAQEIQAEDIQEDAEAEQQRPSWVSWDSSFETVLEPRPEGPVPSVVGSTAQVGPPSSPALGSPRAEELVAASAVGSSSQAWSSPWTSTLRHDAPTPHAHPQATPGIGPAARARSTADALRKLTRRVPGASLPDEDDSLRRPTPTSTTNNPLGLSGALSQYLSATANESRPQKEHYA